MFHNIAIHLLHLLSKIQQNVPLKIIENIKIYILLKMLKHKDFYDNDITNIVCTKPKKDGKCDKALAKLLEHREKIFQISPRAIVCCILNKNIPLLKSLQELGYPIEIAKNAPNFHILTKRSRNDYIISSIMNKFIYTSLPL